MVPWREPYERRRSRTVLREARGEIPRAYSPGAGFQHREEAERFLEELRERLGKFGLELHPEKTRLIEFGR